MSENIPNQTPTTKHYDKVIKTDVSEFTLNLFIVEYSNAIQVAIYDGKPSLGSMSFGFMQGDLNQHLEIFTGKHNQFSNALALILSKRTEKIIYASVNLSDNIIVELEMIKDLLENYFQDQNS